MSDKSDMDSLTEELDNLSVAGREARIVNVDNKESEGPDDGYNSKEEEEEDDEEVELEPLRLPAETDVQETIQLISRGPIPIDHDSHRYAPYTRDTRQNLVSSGDNEAESAAGCCLPTPNVLILRKFDTTNPSKLDAVVTWSNKYEICIQRYRLPVSYRKDFCYLLPFILCRRRLTTINKKSQRTRCSSSYSSTQMSVS